MSPNRKTEKDQRTVMVESFASMFHEILVEHGCRDTTLERCVSWYVKIFRNVELIDLPSVMKGNLADLFSRTTGQDRPEITKRICLIPPRLRSFFKDATRRPTGPRALSLLWDLMQAKKLAAEVPKVFIGEGYKKHHRAMSKEPVPVPDWFSTQEDFFRDFGRRTRSHLDFYRNSLPNGKATFHMKGKDGGRALNIRTEQMSKIRMEPIYVSIHGYPGKGKSLMVQKLAMSLCKRLGYRYPEDTYVRNCAVAHWDGYKGQPICVLDDLGAAGDESSDFSDLIGLVSSSCHVLPMADLRDKGTVFNSPFILSASNYAKHVIQQPTRGGPLSFSASVRRRFRTIDVHGPRRFEVFSQVSPQMISEFDTGMGSRLPHSDQMDQWFPPLGEQSLDRIVDDLVIEFDRKNAFVKDHLETHFAQTLYDFTVYDHGGENFTILDGDQTDPLWADWAKHFKRELIWPKEPGCQAWVQTVAIPEPLKVRVITKAFAETQALKPLQEAMWHALGEYPEFKLSHGVDPQEAVDDLLPFKSEDHYWLSGDYEAATDNLSCPASQQALKWILEEIDDPVVSNWALWENGEHMVSYPLWTGLAPVHQRNGQLMGSFLSFPLLCLLNSTTVRGITDHFRINGDDLLALMTPAQKESWWSRASSLGLIPSIGKNFFSKEFCTINSQMFVFGSQMKVGRPSLRFRGGRPIQNTFHDLCQFLGKLPNMSNYVRRNKESLRLTLRSLDVPKTHGGLGNVFVDPNQGDCQMRRLVYLHDLLKDRKRTLYVGSRPVHIIKNPFVTEDGSRTLAPLLKATASIAEPLIGLGKDMNTDVSVSDLRKCLKFVQKIPSLRDFLKNGRLSDAPPLPECGFTITTSDVLSSKLWLDWALTALPSSVCSSAKVQDDLDEDDDSLAPSSAVGSDLSL